MAVNQNLRPNNTNQSCIRQWSCASRKNMYQSNPAGLQPSWKVLAPNDAVTTLTSVQYVLCSHAHGGVGGKKPTTLPIIQKLACRTVYMAQHVISNHHWLMCLCNALHFREHPFHLNKMNYGHAYCAMRTAAFFMHYVTHLLLEFISLCLFILFLGATGYIHCINDS